VDPDVLLYDHPVDDDHMGADFAPVADLDPSTDDSVGADADPVTDARGRVNDRARRDFGRRHRLRVKCPGCERIGFIGVFRDQSHERRGRPLGEIAAH
jgi:hypothetical protein